MVQKSRRVEEFTLCEDKNKPGDLLSCAIHNKLQQEITEDGEIFVLVFRLLQSFHSFENSFSIDDTDRPRKAI